MNDEQFDLIVQQLQIPSQPALVAARLILVYGERQSDAIHETRCQGQRLSELIEQITILSTKP